MERRRQLMEMQNLLPQEYKRVEYLESDGTAYILTDILPSDTLGFDCTFYTKSSLHSNTNYGCIFGGRRASGNNDFQLTTYTNANDGSFRSGPASTFNAQITRLTKQTAHKRNSVFTNCAGNQFEVPAYSWNNPNTISLFLLHNGEGTFYQGGFGCRIYSISFFNGNKKMREYIPCIKKTDNTPGMYESFTKQFLTNKIGVMIAGDPV